MNIYFCGSMTGSREKQGNYEEIISFLKTYGTVLNEFVGNEKIISYEPEMIFLRDTSNMEKADICIADISVPSTGVGFELGNFYNIGTPTLVLYDVNYPLPSALPRGVNSFVVKSYSNIEEEKNIIKEFISNQ